MSVYFHFEIFAYDKWFDFSPSWIVVLAHADMHGEHNKKQKNQLLLLLLLKLNAPN